ncbi:MAG: DUF1444 family protein [Bacillus sp. (in: firmicutes)]
MKMTNKRMKEILCDKLKGYDFSFEYNQEKEELRVENPRTKKGITISLPPIVAKAEVAEKRAVDETVYYVKEALEVMGSQLSLQGMEEHIYPVIRSTSFPIVSQDGSEFVTNEHTAETRIYYALDLGNTYRLIDQPLLQTSGWNQQKLEESAQQNLLKLSTQTVSDSVGDNVFYFVSTKDGYDASKVLNKQWLESMRGEIKGEMAVAVPHGDVCIVADVRNNVGYDVLAQMCMSFFASGHVPITALSFIYENGKLNPVFILGKNKVDESK